MKKRLLVIDDDSSVRQSLKKVLEDCGYDVLVAVDGKEAESKLNGCAVDLSIVDLNMPNKDGWDVLDDVTTRYPLLPIIVITGMADQLDTLRIIGAAALLKKPIDPPNLLQKIEQLLDENPEERLLRINSSRETEPRPRLDFAV
jgi:two-component system, chemotaxis family, chemotaxis protein CheY